MNHRTPFSDIDKAFSPFFSEHVLITRKTGEKTTVCVSVFDDITDDPLAGDSLDTTVEGISIMFSDPCFPAEVQRGDTVTRLETSGKKYSVTQVRHDPNFGRVVKARLSR